VKQLVDGVQTETDASTWQARREISFATVVMLALGGLTFIGSVLFVWLYVGRNILRGIGNLQRSMQLLSGGDLDTEIHRSRQRASGALRHETDILRSEIDAFLSNIRAA
jgi:methyl-accepting chemotaxis protein